jgi:hypothetical protein
MNTANRTIVTPIKGVVPHPKATFPYFEFNSFNKCPTIIHLRPDLKEQKKKLGVVKRKKRVL